MGAYVAPQRGALTIAEWSGHYLDTLSVTPKTRVSYESLLRSRVLPRWGTVKLSAVTTSAVRAWLVDMGSGSKPLSASRIRQAYHLLSAMLDRAVEDGRLPRNPARGLNGSSKGLLPAAPRNAAPMRYLTHDELHALANAAGGYRPLILTLGYCGLRWGEATALRVRDADLLGNRLSVERAYSDVAGTLLLGDTKTHAARQVGLPAFLRVELSPLMAGKGPDDLLFTTARGSALRSQNFTRDVLAHALRDAGVGRIRLHDLRHTAASLAIAAGANVKAVQRMLGHESATLTLDRYGHLYDGDLDALADRLNAAATDGRRDAAAVLLRSLPANG